MLAPGVHLGPYEVLSRIGAGGMGEVWKGKDTRLDRRVAIKVLPVRFDNAQAKLRFEREAKTISQLNHPNICTLYDVGESRVAGTSIHYLVMELLEGETLEERLTRGPLPAREVLEYGAQIADALDRAHRAGVVHRDLKPGNVMITKTGAKLLDFGVARTIRSATDESPTESAPLTEEGTILGTLQYMSPEQLAGDDVDHRTDIFALGTMLYEMATGQRAFGGRNRVSLIAAIATAEPRPMSEIQPLTPPALEHVVRRCLEKEREDRWQSARDIAEELRFISTGGAAGSQPAVRSRRAESPPLHTSPWGRLAIVALLAALIAALVWRDRTQPADPQKLMVQIPMREGVFAGGALSPDGTRVAYVVMDSNGDYHVAVRSLESGEERELYRAAEASQPFWSPDGKGVGFFSTGHLYVMSSEGGAARRLCRARRTRGAPAWSRGGEILFAASSPELQRISASGGTPRAATVADAKSGEAHRDPVFVSDDEFLFTRSGKGIYLGTLADPNDARPVLETTNGWYFVRGTLFVRKERTLQAYRFDAASGKAELAPEKLELPFVPSVIRFAQNGNLAVRAREADERYRLLWHDRAGHVAGETGEAGLWREPALSPDGKRLAVSGWDAALGEGVILTYDLARGVKTQLVRAPFDVMRPAWTADGKRIVYTASQSGMRRLFAINADGSGEPEPLPSPLPAPAETTMLATKIAGDLMSYLHANDVWLLRMSSGETTRVTASTEDPELFAEISPDGAMVAHTSEASGTSEVYVQSVASGQRMQISTNGGYDPKWRGDGRELYYIDRADYLVAVSLRVTPNGIEADAPKRLFHAEFRGNNSAFDVTRDGERFLILTGPPPEPRPFYLLVNWFSWR